MLQLEVVYALPDRQTVIPLELPLQSTVKDAVLASKLLDQYPELSLHELDLGIFSQSVTLETKLHNNDRIEIYRPLQIDPKQARRQRASLK